MRTWLLAGAAVVMTALAGCGGRTYPVTGVVVFKDGQPAKELAGYYVQLESAELKVSGHGVIGSDGRFEVTTNRPDDGAPPGRYKVAISPPAGDGDSPGMKWLIPRRFGDFTKSNLEVEVMRQRNDVRLEVERLGR